MLSNSPRVTIWVLSAVTCNKYIQNRKSKPEQFRRNETVRICLLWWRPRRQRRRNLNHAPQAGQQAALRSRWSLQRKNLLLNLQLAHCFSSKISTPKTKTDCLRNPFYFWWRQLESEPRFAPDFLLPFSPYRAKVPPRRYPAAWFDSCRLRQTKKEVQAPLFLFGGD